MPLRVLSQGFEAGDVGVKAQQVRKTSRRGVCTAFDGRRDRAHFKKERRQDIDLLP